MKAFIKKKAKSRVLVVNFLLYNFFGVGSKLLLL